MFLNTSVDDLKREDPYEASSKPNGLDVIEYGLIWALSRQFHHGWDIKDTTPLESPTSVGRQSTTSFDKNEIRQFTSSEIRSHFSDNLFLKNEKKYNAEGFSLPKDTMVRRKNTGHEREISFESNSSSVKIVISQRHRMPIQQGVLGVIPKDPTDLGRFVELTYSVHFEAELAKYWPMPWRKKEDLKRWHENIGAMLEGFDWKSVRSVIKDDLSNKAVELILKQK